VRAGPWRFSKLPNLLVPYWRKNNGGAAPPLTPICCHSREITHVAMAPPLPRAAHAVATVAAVLMFSALAGASPRAPTTCGNTLASIDACAASGGCCDPGVPNGACSAAECAKPRAAATSVFLECPTAPAIAQIALDMAAAYADSFGLPSGVNIVPSTCGADKRVTFTATYNTPLPDNYANAGEITAVIEESCIGVTAICQWCAPAACVTGGYCIEETCPDDHICESPPYCAVGVLNNVLDVFQAGTA
jgi:hypothetical protein